MQQHVLRSDSIEIRPAEFLALVGARPLNLTARELDLLTALVERAGRIVSRQELYETVWHEPYRKSDRSVDVYVAKLRHKLDDAIPGTRFIHTHFGFGYRLEQAPQRLPEGGGGSPAERFPSEAGDPPPPPRRPPSHRLHISETSP